MITTLGYVCTHPTYRVPGCWATDGCWKLQGKCSNRSLIPLETQTSSAFIWSRVCRGVKNNSEKEKGASRLTISNKPWLRVGANAQRLLISSSGMVFFIPGDKKGGGCCATFGSHFPVAFISPHTADPVTHPASKTPPKPIAGR